MNTLRRLARNAYITVLEVFDGRHQLKRSGHFSVLMNHIDAYTADEMAAHISGAASISDYDADELLWPACDIACCFDEEVPDLLMDVLTLQARTGCDLRVASYFTMMTMAIFDIDADDCRQVEKSVRHVTSNTSLDVEETFRLITCIGARAAMLNVPLWRVTTDIVGAYRRHCDPSMSSEELHQAIGREVTYQYELEQREVSR